MPPKNNKNDILRTIDVIPPEGKTIAPRTLAEIDGVEHWTADTHKIWWTLLDHAWGAKMDDPKASFEIDTAALRFEGHDSNDRLAAHLLKMQKTVVSVPVENDRVLRVQMLGSTTMGRGESSYGILRYDWPKKLIEVLRDPAKYGKIELKTVRAMRSAYALRLYTIIAARFEQRHTKPEASLSLDELRSWLAVPEGKLGTWSNLKKWAIDPAVREVNDHCPAFSVEIEPVKIGKSVRSVIVRWSPKLAYSDMEQRAVAELNRHSAGRRARAAGTVQTVIDDVTLSLPRDLIQTALTAGLTRNAINQAEAVSAPICKLDMREMLRRALSETGFQSASNKGGYFVKMCENEARQQRGY